LQIVDAMGNIVNDNVAIRTAFSVTPDSFQTMVGMYDRQDAPDSLLSTLSTAVSRLAAGHRDNQRQFVDVGILPRLVELGRDERRSSGDIQLTAVRAFLNLVDGQFSFIVFVLQGVRTSRLREISFSEPVPRLIMVMLPARKLERQRGLRCRVHGQNRGSIALLR